MTVLDELIMWNIPPVDSQKINKATDGGNTSVIERTGENG